MSAIRLEGVGKRYLQSDDARQLLLHRLARLGRSRSREVWALKDVDLSCERGESIGIIGRNGSGKTTMLRLLSGVSAPTTGRVQVKGGIAPLIGVGVGFHPELTGRENVFVNGRLLGMSEREVRRKFDSIVDFSEIEEFLDSPVKFYSSGMFLRLAFSVAIHTDPEILLVDEVLAVGDMAFQLKCNERMREIQAAGATIVVVSHNLQSLSRLVPRAVLLDRGRLLFDGDVEEAIGRYHEVLYADQADWDGRAQQLAENGRAPRFAGGAGVSVSLLGEDGLPARSFRTGDQVVVRLTAEFSDEVEDPVFGLLVAPAGLGALFTMQTSPGDYRGVHGPGRPLTAEVTLSNRLLAGSYIVRGGVYDPNGDVMLGSSRDEPFHVTTLAPVGGMVDLEPSVRIDGRSLELTRVERLSGRAAH